MTTRLPLLRALAISLLIGAACHAAPPAAAVPAPDTVGAATLAELARATRAATTVPEHAFVLMDLIGPRMSATPEGERARSYASERFTEYGLENVREEVFPLLAWERNEAAMTVLAPYPVARREMSILSLGQVGSFEVEARVVDAGHAVAEDFERLGDGVRGAIILAQPGQPEGYGRGVHRSEKIALAEAAGAAGFVLIAPGSLVQVGVATLGDHETRIPAVAADYETGAWLTRIVERFPEEVRARLVTDNQMERTTDANVLADIPGTTDEVVLVGAHLDSWDLATGAVDNGSGSVAVLDIARALAEHVRESGERPRRTIRFALWMGEELGLYGSRHHVETRKESGRLDDYVAVLNLDVVGTPTGLGAVGRPEAAALLRPIARGLNAGGWELSEEVGTGGGLYSDHMPFMLEGVPILTLGRTLPERAAGVTHTSADTRDKLDEEGIADAAAVSAALLWAVANAADHPLDRWSFERTGEVMESLGFRDPLERSGEWRW